MSRAIGLWWLVVVVVLGAASTVVPGELPGSGVGAEPQDPSPPAYLFDLRLGWTFFDAGNLTAALEAFEKAAVSEAGRNAAEVHYALSAVWWQRRNAFAAHSRLVEALRAREESWTWESGEDQEWDRRIESRLRYIERNFSAVRLRPAQAGRVLPPLPDPLPRDPLLRSFAEATLDDITETVGGGEGVRHAFLPAGSYWVGDELLALVAGLLAPGQGVAWDLQPDRGRPRRQYRERLAAVESEASSRASGKKVRSVRHKRGARTGSEPVVPRSQTMTLSPGADVRPSPLSAAFVEQAPIDFGVVRSYTAADVSAEISQRWRAPTFHVQYVVSCPNLDSEHELLFVDHGFFVRFDPGAELRIRGDEQLVVRLRSDWLVGDYDALNYVDLWFDGTHVLVAVNGVEFGPIRVRDQPLGRNDSKWLIRIGDRKTRMSHLRVESWSGLSGLER